MHDKKVAVAASASRPATQRLPTAEERRRAQRVLLRMPVIVHVPGKNSLNGYTHTVSQNGAMIVVPEPLGDAVSQIGGPVLLVDDQVDTGWTMTVAARLLRDAGAPAVLPLALAVTTG